MGVKTKPLNRITRTTWIPLSLAITAIGGGSSWVATISFLTYKHEGQIARVEQKGEDSFKVLSAQMHVVEGEIIRLRTLIEVRDGRNIRDDSPAPESENAASLRRRVEECRIQNESHLRPAVDARSEGPVDEGA